MNHQHPNAGQLIELREQLVALEQQRPTRDDALLSTGCAALDRLFPDNGLRRGTVLEWLSPGPGSGVSWLALAAVRAALVAGGLLVLCDREAAFHPWALQALGIDTTRVVLVRAKDAADHRWAIDQALRSPAVAAVWARLSRLDAKTSRRFQLAAEQGGVIGVLVRPATARGCPTWADVQLGVTPLPDGPERAWRVESARSRDSGESVTTEIAWEETTGTLHPLNRHHETHPLSLVTRLADAASAALS
ncbi:MAG TPA: hypothetical protein VL096_04735 [Pirellulaceae bacterium]|nr:hypothetical protein [Pirellulaceae bacterium]